MERMFQGPSFYQNIDSQPIVDVLIYLACHLKRRSTRMAPLFAPSKRSSTANQIKRAAGRQENQASDRVMCLGMAVKGKLSFD